MGQNHATTTSNHIEAHCTTLIFWPSTASFKICNDRLDRLTTNRDLAIPLVHIDTGHLRNHPEASQHISLYVNMFSFRSNMYHPSITFQFGTC